MLSAVNDTNIKKSITIILPSATECDRVAVGPRSLVSQKDLEINTDWR